MAEWIVCPNCNLKHSLRPTRTCPRCRLSVDGSEGSGAGVDAPEAPATSVEARFASSPPLAPTAQPPVRYPRSAGSWQPPAGSDGCVHHPEVTEGLVSCRRCGRRFCGDCVIALHGAFFCIDCKGERVRDIQSGAVERPVGVMECIGMGWELVTQDLWPIWTVGLVLLAITVGAGVLGAAPFVGGIFQLAVSVFLTPPLEAGLVYALRRKIDGGRAEVNDLFEGFRSQYWNSILIKLPVLGLTMVFVILLVVGVFLFAAAAESMSTATREPMTVVAVVLVALVALVAIVVGMVLTTIVWFAYVEMWDGPTSAWESFRAGAQMVRANLGRTLGLAFMLSVISVAALLGGVLALCVGLVFTLPFMTVWSTVSYVYAYRSWSRARATAAH